MTAQTGPSSGPYAAAAQAYWQRGWRGLLPLPAASKAPVPPGWTGALGAFPSWPDVQAWLEGREGAGNLALRLPHHVIGLDVDAYDGKPGAATVADLEQRWGPLPATWRSTSRDDGVSGISLYLAPEHLAWPGELPGKGVEVIQHRHRYVVAPPSVHPSGRRYRWIGPDGLDVLGDVPDVESLPHLPAAWVEGLTGGALATDVARVDLGDAGAMAWLGVRGAGTPCRMVAGALERIVRELGATGADRGSRHEAGRRGTQRLAHLAAEGHPGALVALEQAAAAWSAAFGAEGRQPDAGEWRRLVVGAVDRSAAREDQSDVDPCLNPFSGLLATPPGGADLPTLRTPAAPQQAPDVVATGAPTYPQQAHDGPAADVPAPVLNDGLEAATSVYTSAEQPAGDGAREGRSSWWPTDLEAALTGVNPEPAPAFLLRSDGVALVYPGKVNGLLGESESAKSWIALHAVAQQVGAGRPVTFLDFEDSVTGIVSRLLALGCEPDALRTHLRYVGPDSGLDNLATLDLLEHLEQHAPGLVVVDGVNAAMTLLGLDLNDNRDATNFAQKVLRPISDRGAAVLYVDHVSKGAALEARGGIGAQAKRAMTSGAAFRVEAITLPAPGQAGRLRLRVDKDRPGRVREHAAPGKAGAWIGDALFHPEAEGRLTITLTPPDVAAAAAGRLEGEDGSRPVSVMFRVCEALAEAGEATSGRGIKRLVRARAEDVDRAVAVLVAEGNLSSKPGPRGAALYSLERHTREGRADDDGAGSDDLAGLIAPPVSAGEIPPTGSDGRAGSDVATADAAADGPSSASSASRALPGRTDPPVLPALPTASGLGSTDPAAADRALPPVGSGSLLAGPDGKRSGAPTSDSLEGDGASRKRSSEDDRPQGYCRRCGSEVAGRTTDVESCAACWGSAGPGPR